MYFGSRFQMVQSICFEAPGEARELRKMCGGRKMPTSWQQEAEEAEESQRGRGSGLDPAPVGTTLASSPFHGQCT